MSSYLLILRRNQAEALGLPEAEMFTRFRDWTRALHENGVLQALERLKPSAEGTTLRARNGSNVTEGASDGASEAVIGYYLVVAADLASAQTIAKDCPILLVGGSVEIRETEPFPKS